MKIAVVGTGGVGGYFGGRLAQAGEEVWFIARGDHLQALKTRGLKVESVKGDFLIQPAHVTDSVEEVGEVDLVLVAVKSWQVPEVAESIRPMVGPNTTVLPLQNGVEAPSQLAQALGDRPVLGGLCRIISFIAEPGVIRHVGGEPYIQIGELDNRTSDRLDTLKQLFEKAVGITIEIAPNIESALWSKFLFIVTWSSVGAITRVPIDVILSLPKTRGILEKLIEEVAQVARARNIDLPEDICARTIALMETMPSGGTSSMQRDIMEGRPSELDSQTGAVTRLGREAGVPTPLHDLIYDCLLPQERIHRGDI